MVSFVFQKSKIDPFEKVLNDFHRYLLLRKAPSKILDRVLNKPQEHTYVFCIVPCLVYILTKKGPKNT